MGSGSSLCEVWALKQTPQSHTSWSSWQIRPNRRSRTTSHKQQQPVVQESVHKHRLSRRVSEFYEKRKKGIRKHDVECWSQPTVPAKGKTHIIPHVPTTPTLRRALIIWFMNWSIKLTCTEQKVKLLFLIKADRPSVAKRSMVDRRAILLRSTYTERT
jgi:hypothetical protein